LFRRQVRRHRRLGVFQLRAGCRLSGRFLPRKIRTEGDRGLGVERNVEFAQLLVAVEVSIDAAQRHLFFGFVEIHAEQALGGIEPKAIDSLRGRGLLRQGRGGRTRGKKGRKEASSIHGGRRVPRPLSN
jgi:hypothetical protein